MNSKQFKIDYNGCRRFCTERYDVNGRLKIEEFKEFNSPLVDLEEFISFPSFSNTRIMMMPIKFGDMDSIPPCLSHYKNTIQAIFKAAVPYFSYYRDYVVYLTIDEKHVLAGRTHRRPGLHVDGIYENVWGSWGGGYHNGMFTVSDVAACKVYEQDFKGFPSAEGDCAHLRDQCKEETATILKANMLYWMAGLTVHESLPMAQNTHRTFIRLSMPSEAPWFEGYTENPLGIKPRGNILPRRVFMDWQ